MRLHALDAWHEILLDLLHGGFVAVKLIDYVGAHHLEVDLAGEASDLRTRRPMFDESPGEIFVLAYRRDGENAEISHNRLPLRARRRIGDIPFEARRLVEQLVDLRRLAMIDRDLARFEHVELALPVDTADR